MMRSILAVSISSFFVLGAAQAETRTYDVESFTAIDVSAGLDVVFETGAAQSVQVESESGDFDDIKVLVNGDTLVLSRAKQVNWSWGQRESYLVTVSAPVLSSIDASSGADVKGSGLTGSTVRIDTSSGADADITGIEADEVQLESSSGSDLTASGTCGKVIAESSSGSDIMARNLICTSGEADASSGSDITIHASDSVYADVSSGADVTVHGSPANTDVDKSSGGSVNIRS
ncbi:MAG: head GIN domain-containing protein [Henriciella sp.]|nr:head GIN domain-containing protein [Henriciella sp.]